MNSTDRRALDLQRAGQDLFRKKDYTGALAKLNNALTYAVHMNTQVSILDNRAAVLAKHQPNDLMPALRDAQKIMKLQKANATGYLRAGQILQLMGKIDVARETYNYGLKQIGIGDGKGRNRLEAMLAKLSARQERQVRMDPFRSLPFELADMILKQLPLANVVRLQRVCKAWREFLINYQGSICNLDFSGATKPVPIKTIKKYLQRMQYSITTITLPKPDSIDIATLQLMVKTSGKLEELLIGRWSKFLDFDILSAVRLRPGLRILQLHGSIAITEAVDIIFALPALEVFVCHQIYGVTQHEFRYRGKIHNMKRLHLSGLREEFNSGPIIDLLLKCLPLLGALEILSVEMNMPRPDLLHLERLETCILRNVGIKRFPLLPPAIKHLDLSRNDTMDSWVDDVRDSTLPNLEVLDISGCRRLKKIDIESLFGMSKERCRVNVLRMGMSPGIQCDSLEWLIALGMDESLIHLSVEGNSTLSDTAVNDLVKFQALEELDLGNTCVSGIGVLKLVTRGSGNLKWLGLDLCDHISKETVDDVRKLGVAVSHKRSQQLKGGRKVRHGY